METKEVFMPYESVDQLQKALTENVFGYAKSSKKAAGRALGTIVEIITFYLLESWGLNESLSIEKRIPEFGNSEITHNVEYSLHPKFSNFTLEIAKDGKSLTAHKLLKSLTSQGSFRGYKKTNNRLLSSDGILRNACVIAKAKNSYLVASIKEENDKNFVVSITEQSTSPYAIFECKRVGVEEGMKKGPQTIEKAKQGAYVAKSISSLQKVRAESGDLYGVIYQNDNVIRSSPYRELLKEIIRSDDANLLRKFILTVGVVSNHGNWFTAEDHNKELKVLAQSYDWLFFLTDKGLTEFIEDVIFNPLPKYQEIRAAFLASYALDKKKNLFTKVQMDFQAHQQLINYFKINASKIEKWFNVISPINGDLLQLRKEIKTLQDKKWEEISQ